MSHHPDCHIPGSLMSECPSCRMITSLRAERDALKAKLEEAEFSATHYKSDRDYAEDQIHQADLRHEAINAALAACREALGDKP